MGALVIIMTVIFVLSCIFITFLVLIQPPHADGGAGGLAGAFSGAGGDSFFGTKAMTMAGKVTIFLSVLIVGLAITINKINGSRKDTGIKSIMGK